MGARWITYEVVGITVAVRFGLFAPLGSDVAGLAERVGSGRAGSDILRGQFPLALPTGTGRFGSGADS